MIGLVLGPLVFVTIYLTPFPSLSPEAHRLLAILGLVFVFWVSEVLPLTITTLIGVILAGLLGIGTPKEILAPFADPVVFLLMGSFFLAQAKGISSVPPALGATIGASFGFMFPISTPPNAIVYGSGKIPLRTMIRTGIVFDLIGFTIIWSGLRLLCPFLGWSF